MCLCLCTVQNVNTLKESKFDMSTCYFCHSTYQQTNAQTKNTYTNCYSAFHCEINFQLHLFHALFGTTSTARVCEFFWSHTMFTIHLEVLNFLSHRLVYPDLKHCRWSLRLRWKNNNFNLILDVGMKFNKIVFVPLQCRRSPRPVQYSHLALELFLVINQSNMAWSFIVACVSDFSLCVKLVRDRQCLVCYAFSNCIVPSSHHVQH